ERAGDRVDVPGPVAGLGRPGGSGRAFSHQGGAVKGQARKLVLQLAGIQVVAWGATGMLVVAFAPRLLLLDPVVVAGSVSLALWGWPATVALIVAGTLVVARRVHPLLDAIAEGATRVDPAQVLSLYALPSRLVALALGGTLIVGTATLASTLRPE